MTLSNGYPAPTTICEMQEIREEQAPIAINTAPVDGRQRIGGRSPGSRLKWRQIPSQISLFTHVQVRFSGLAVLLVEIKARCTCSLQPNRIQLRGQLRLLALYIVSGKLEFPISPKN